MTLTLKLNEGTKNVRAYEVLPGLYAHRTFVFGRDTWQLSHHSGLGVGCYAPTLKRIRAVAIATNGTIPMDWTQSAEEIQKQSDGANWLREFHHHDCRI